jgi:hypothetical protein
MGSWLYSGEPPSLVGMADNGSGRHSPGDRLIIAAKRRTLNRNLCPQANYTLRLHGAAQLLEAVRDLLSRAAQIRR